VPWTFCGCCGDEISRLIIIFDGAIVQAVIGTGVHADAARIAAQALLDAQRIP
jgi:hypothetical protein